MANRSTVFTGTGSYLPANDITNEDFYDHEFYGSDGNRMLNRDTGELMTGREGVQSFEKRKTGMRRFAIFLLTLSMFNETNLYFAGNAVQNDNLTQETTQQIIQKQTIELTAMEALDMVKNHYTVNFEKVVRKDTNDYYYKLAEADYYLVYEGYYQEGSYYLIHLYEFIMDFPKNNIGHTVTYGWFIVDKETGEMTEQT